MVTWEGQAYAFPFPCPQHRIDGVKLKFPTPNLTKFWVQPWLLLVVLLAEFSNNNLHGQHSSFRLILQMIHTTS